MTFPQWLSAERLAPEPSKNAASLRLRASFAVCLLAGLGCKGSIETQEDRSGLRPGMRGGAAGAPSAGGAAQRTTPAGGVDGESTNVSGLDGDSSSSGTPRGGGAARRPREPEPEDAGVVDLDAGELPEDAGVLVDAGAIDAGGVDAGAALP